MTPAVIALPGYEYLSALVSQRMNCRVVEATIRTFPDKETYVQIHDAVEGSPLILIGSLNNADSKILPLIFLAEKAKEMGASSIVLVAPYLGYMRQDQAFNPGEAVTAKYFAKVISSHFDHLITIDPHLHRIHSLDEIYSCSTQCLHAAPLFAQWLKAHIVDPVILGPDSESKQWVEEISDLSKVSFLVFSKRRLGDKEVRLELPDMAEYEHCTPVLVDDIISTGGTLLKAVGLMKNRISQTPVCMAIHGIFSANSYAKLKEVSADVVTTNSILHESNKIDISGLLVTAIKKYIQESVQLK